MKRASRFSLSLALVISIMIVTASQVQAQFLGHNAKGDFGLLSGSQPDPGFYFAPYYYRYDAGKLKDRFGNPLRPNISGSLDANAYIATLWYVSEFKIFGANYGFMFVPAFTDNSFEVPILDVQSRSGTGFADLYFQPVNLGWKTERVDLTAGLGIYAPTGRYDPDASDNLGLGMWTFEPFFGATVYFDEAKSWHFATTAFYETHTKKKDTNIDVGDILTLEGGFGKSFMGGALSIGSAYYAQLKVTRDDIGLNIPLQEELKIGKHRVFGIGPEGTIPIATKTKLIAMVSVRYLWEFGARTTLDGRTLMIAATFPIPSVKLP